MNTTIYYAHMLIPNNIQLVILTDARADKAMDLCMDVLCHFHHMTEFILILRHYY